MMSGCTSTTSAPMATPTPQVIYVTVTPTPTIQTAPQEMAYLQSVDCGLDPTIGTVYHCRGQVSIKNGVYTDAQVILMYPDGATYNYDVGGLGGSNAIIKPFYTYPANRYQTSTPEFFIKLDDNQFPVIMTGSTTISFDNMQGATGIAYMNGPSSLPAAPNTPTSASTQVPSKSITFQGSGDDVQSFTATGDGMRIFSMSYSGDGNFAIWLKDSQGNDINLLANEIGSYNGKKSERLGPGTYYLDVTASGPWTITLASM